MLDTTSGITYPDVMSNKNNKLITKVFRLFQGYVLH